MEKDGLQPTLICKRLLHRLLRGTGDLDSVQSQPCSSRSPVASTTNTLTTAKSFKEAVSSPARLLAPSLDCNNFEKRLAEAELSLKEHNQRYLDRKAEALGRQKRELNLIEYDVQETAEEADAGIDTFGSLLTKVDARFLQL